VEETSNTILEDPLLTLPFSSPANLKSSTKRAGKDFRYTNKAVTKEWRKTILMQYIMREIYLESPERRVTAPIDSG
jgi:hypothetical protein